jgi:hypothetical protein
MLLAEPLPPFVHRIRFRQSDKRSFRLGFELLQEGDVIGFNTVASWSGARVLRSIQHGISP